MHEESLAQDEISLRDYLAILKRRSLTVTLTFLFTAVIGFFIAYGYWISKVPHVGHTLTRFLLLPDIYRSKGAFMVDMQKTDQVTAKTDDKLDELVKGGASASRYIETQMRVMMIPDVLDPNFQSIIEERVRRMNPLTAADRQQLAEAGKSAKPAVNLLRQDMIAKNRTVLLNALNGVYAGKNAKNPESERAIERCIELVTPETAQDAEELRTCLKDDSGQYQWQALKLVDKADRENQDPTLTKLLESCASMEYAFRITGLHREDVTPVAPVNEERADVITLSAESKNRALVQGFVYRWMLSYNYWDERHQERDMLLPISKAQRELERATIVMAEAVKRVEDFKRQYPDVLKYVAQSEVADKATDSKGNAETAGRMLSTLEESEQQLQASIEGQNAQINSIRSSLRQLKNREPMLLTQERTTNTDILKLQAQLVDLNQQMQAKLTVYNQDHPVIKQLAGQIASVKAAIKDQPPMHLVETRSTNPEIAKTEAGLRELEASQREKLATVKTIRQQKLSALNEIKGLGGKRAELVQLITDRDVKQEKVRFLNSKLSELRLRTTTRIAPISELTSADLPSRPEKPNRPVIFLMSLVAGLFFGVCFSLLQEFMDDRVSTKEDVERYLLGMLPEGRKLLTLSTVPPVRDKRMLLLTRHAEAFSDVDRQIERDVEPLEKEKRAILQEHFPALKAEYEQAENSLSIIADDENTMLSITSGSGDESLPAIVTSAEQVRTPMERVEEVRKRVETAEEEATRNLPRREKERVRKLERDIKDILNRVNRTKSRGASVLESYRHIRTRARFAAIDEEIQCVMVTSTNEGEGKSTTAINLAVAMAMEEGRSVIIVDADLRRPSLHEKLNLNIWPGLAHVLINRDFSLDQALKDIDIDNPHSGDKVHLRVLTAGTDVTNSTELLSSRRMMEIMEELRTKADYIVFDCPPHSVAADAQVLANVMDGIIYVLFIGGSHAKKLPSFLGMLHKLKERVTSQRPDEVDKDSEASKQQAVDAQAAQAGKKRRQPTLRREQLRKSFAAICQANAVLLGVVYNRYEDQGHAGYYGSYSYNYYHYRYGHYGYNRYGSAHYSYNSYNHSSGSSLGRKTLKTGNTAQTAENKLNSQVDMKDINEGHGPGTNGSTHRNGNRSNGKRHDNS